MLVSIGSQPSPDVRDRGILGTNVEAGEEVVRGLLADRLRNPKFAGPQNVLTKMAAEWEPFPQPVGRANWNCELTPGVGMSGEQTQLLSRHSGERDIGVVQTGVWVDAGERLEVEVWALAQGGANTLLVGVRPSASGEAPYAEVPLRVAAPYWRRYRATLDIEVADDAAEFYVRLSGPGAVWLDQVHLRPAGEHIRPDTVELVREVAPAAIRFPGGCLSTVYRWAQGVGPVELRPCGMDPIWMGRIDYDFGTDEFLALCKHVDAIPHVTVALGSGTPEQAADWARHCAKWHRARDGDLPLMYWHIGNEQWGDWEIGHTTPEEYAALLRDWVPAIRNAYPPARIVALGQGEGSLRNLDPAARERDRAWRRTLTEQAAEHFDVLSHQMYVVVDRSWDRAPEAFLGELRNRTQKLLATVAATGDHLRPLGRSVALTEWNLWSAATIHGGYVEPADGAHALFTAAVLSGLIRLGPVVELANHYSLLNWFGVLHVRGRQAHATPIARLLSWYRDALPGRAVEVRVRDADSPDLDLLCLERESDGSRRLLAINWSAQHACEVALDGGWRAGRVTRIGAEDPFSPAGVDAHELPDDEPLRIAPVSVACAELLVPTSS